MTRNPASTHKRVVIRKHDKTLLRGFVDPRNYLHEAAVEILDLDGRLAQIPLQEIKGVFFVREFEGNPERTERKVFHSRPRLGGLWVRLTFKDNEVMEGLIQNNLLSLDPQGFHITPPDLYSNNLKIFVPRASLAAMEVLGVISDGAARRAIRRSAESRGVASETSRQIALFPPVPGAPNK